MGLCAARMQTMAEALAWEGSFYDACRLGWPANGVLLRTSEGREITYAEAGAGAARLATLFAASGVRKGDRVAVQVEKCPEALLLYLACLRYGAVYVPVNPAFTPSETRHILEDAEPAMVVCKSAHAQLARDCCGEKIKISTLGADGDGSLIKDLARCEPAAGLTPQAADLAVILYTSGTTGRPKGAMHTHRSLLINAVALRDLWRFTPDDVLLHSLPFFHAHGLFVSTNCTLTSGSTLLWHSRFDADAVCAGLAQSTVFMGVPTMYQRMLKSPGLNAAACRAIRLFASGSSALSEDAFRMFEQKTGHVILERYGMSEAGIIAANPYDRVRKPKSVGIPLPVTEVKVIDADGHPVAAYNNGAVWIRGESILRGYWRRPDRQAEDLTADGWFNTGDIGYFDSDGYLYLVARAKDVIISGGYNVYPVEVEDVLKRMSGIGDAAVIGVPHPEYGEGVMAVVCAVGISEQSVIEHARRDLVGYKVPKRVFFVEDLPKNAIGKVLKQELKGRYATVFATPAGTLPVL
jgi:malonyl-CoA/methylmalonyl-CoA synthetase